jgi:hypothetical protein
MIAPALLGVALAMAGANGGLEQCRKLDKEFDTKAMVKPCETAADDATLSVAERVEALRLLAFAHILNGDEALAEPAFLRMLVLSPGGDLPADAGPRFKEIFAQVKKRFDSEGKVTASFTAPPADTPAPVQLQVDVTDKLGRIVSARVRMDPDGAAAREDKLVRQEIGVGLFRYSGTVPEPVVEAPADAAAPIEPKQFPYDVVFDGWDGKPVTAEPAVSGALSRGGEIVDAGGESQIPWLWIGVGAGAVVLVGAVTGGVIGWCFLAGPCRTQEAWVRVQVQDPAKGDDE